MPDFGQYSEKEVYRRIMPHKGTGVCERCGKKTRTKTIFGMTLCNQCWNAQTKKKVGKVV